MQNYGNFNGLSRSSAATKMIPTRKISPRAEYQNVRAEQVNASAPLQKVSPRLKSLKAEVEYYDSSGAMRLGGVYKALTPTWNMRNPCFVLTATRGIVWVATLI